MTEKLFNFWFHPINKVKKLPDIPCLILSGISLFLWVIPITLLIWLPILLSFMIEDFRGLND